MASKGFTETSVSAQAVQGRKFMIVRTDWNCAVTERLAGSCRLALEESGVRAEDILEETVPGAFELIYAASRVAANSSVDAIIAIGCVVRGGTPHFDYICQGVTQGLASLNTSSQVPVIFGVLTVDTYEQAEARCGGKEGDKGREFALTAIKMAQFASRFVD